MTSSEKYQAKIGLLNTKAGLPVYYHKMKYYHLMYRIIWLIGVKLPHCACMQYLVLHEYKKNGNGLSTLFVASTGVEVEVDKKSRRLFVDFDFNASVDAT